MACLLAPTVPSEPSPQNLQRTVPVSDTTTFSPAEREVFVTSSSIPTVKCVFGFRLFRLSNTAFISDGVVSFEPSPNRPPIIIGAFSLS